MAEVGERIKDSWNMLTARMDGQEKKFEDSMDKVSAGFAAHARYMDKLSQESTRMLDTLHAKISVTDHNVTRMEKTLEEVKSGMETMTQDMTDLQNVKSSPQPVASTNNAQPLGSTGCPD